MVLRRRASRARAPLKILQLRFIHFLQNTSRIYTVPSIPGCLWLTGSFIGSMIISTVQFLWSHRYLVVINYMSYVAVYTLYVGIWMINCDIYSFDWNCIQYNDSVFTILNGVREDIYVHVRSLPCKVIDYNIFNMHTYFSLLILFSCKDVRKIM